MRGSFHHQKFTALCVLLNGESNMSVFEYDEYKMMLFNAINRLDWLAERPGCLSCKYFDNEHGMIKGCQKADGKMPPDNVQKTGCEFFENKFQIPF